MTLAGCGTSRSSRSASNMSEIQNIRMSMPGAALHTVRPGETLWRISKMYGVDVDELVRVNSLQDKSSVDAGQVLVIPRSVSVSIPAHPVAVSPGSSPNSQAAPLSRPASSNIYARDSFIWPLKGPVISGFGAKTDQARNKGIDIQSYEGKDIRASRRGTVVFCDDQLKGFGKTVILDHGDNYQTVYAYNSEILVKVGDAVPQNTVIAKVGRTGRAKEPCLHFEIRKDGEPRDPFYYLPR
jgi:murein DD-endopeptidase MepM/ murein hydrolase activator NlpD